MKNSKLFYLSLVFPLILLISICINLQAVEAGDHKKWKDDDDHEAEFWMMPDTTEVSGCIEMVGFSLENSTVILKQKGEPKQVKKLYADGCYEFWNVVPGKKFKLYIRSEPIVVAPTANVTIFSNLDSRTDISATNLPFDVNNASGTSHFTTIIVVYDSLRNDHIVKIYYRKNQPISAGGTPANSGTPYGGGLTWPLGYPAEGGIEWEWYAVVSGADSTAGVDQIQAWGRLEFNINGALYYSESLPSPTGGFNFAGEASQNQPISFHFGNDIADGGSGLEGTTQFGSTSTTSYIFVE